MTLYDELIPYSNRVKELREVVRLYELEKAWRDHQNESQQAAEVILYFAGNAFKLIKPFMEVEYELRNIFLYATIGKDFMSLYKTCQMVKAFRIY